MSETQITEKEIAKALITARSGSAFSLKRKTVMLSVRNVSWGFFGNGESDIIAVDTHYKLYECEIKVSIADFRKDFRKNPEIAEERRQKLYNKFYAFPHGIFVKNKEEITSKAEKLGFGIIILYEHVYSNGVALEPETIKASIEYSDHIISQGDFNKLARLACFRAAS